MNETHQIIVFNSEEAQRKSIRRWQTWMKRVPSQTRSALLLAKTVYTATSEYKELIATLAEGTEVIVVGGDSTVHRVANDLATHNKLQSCSLGFIATGSRCDFGKWREVRVVKTSVSQKNRTGLETSLLRPLLVELMQSDGTRLKKLCLLSCSVGIGAEANSFFSSSPSRLLKFFGAISTNIAALYAILRSFLFAKPVSFDVLLRNDYEVTKHHMRTTHFTALRTGWLWGMFRFPTTSRVSQRLFDVFIAPRERPLSLFLSLIKVLLGKVAEKDLLHSRTKEVHLVFESNTAVEIDRETYYAKNIKISAAENCIRVQGPGEVPQACLEIQVLNQEL